ncbi:MAG: hypothetical protein O7H41_20680 [Planctomycetota bacterium]|nr:hypothetical protein [Planctomycetota bacterium]
MLDEGVTDVVNAIEINFIGDDVSVVDAGGGRANVTIDDVLKRTVSQTYTGALLTVQNDLTVNDDLIVRGQTDLSTSNLGSLATQVQIGSGQAFLSGYVVCQRATNISVGGSGRYSFFNRYSEVSSAGGSPNRAMYNEMALGGGTQSGDFISGHFNLNGSSTSATADLFGVQVDVVGATASSGTVVGILVNEDNTQASPGTGRWAAWFRGDVEVRGDFDVSGTKNFVMPHPEDPTKEIVFTALEGPESGVFVRGTSSLVNGEAVIDLPDVFGLASSSTAPVTVYVTPLSAESRGLAVVERSNKRIVVKELQKGQGNYEFDWVVYAVRVGFEDHQTIRARSTAPPGER